MDPVWTYDELLRTRTPATIRSAVRTGGLRRLRYGVYGPAGADALATKVLAEQRVDPYAAASHHTAAVLLGIPDADADVLHLTVPHARVRRSGPGLTMHRSRAAIPVVRVGALLVTDPCRTVLDLARWCAEPEGLVIADAALRAGVCTRDQLVRGLQTVRGLDGAGRARAVVERCREGAESPMETRLRAMLVRAGLREPVLQHRIATMIGTVRVDLAWLAERVCVEYDGWAWHADRTAFANDRRRWRALTAAGWDVHPVTADDLHRDGRLAASVREALRRRSV